ncbi:MAG TPA: hypothetical protein VMW07_05590 [Gallionella sp.]|nr:hypothetical protein [Gallionella sp.]
MAVPLNGDQINELNNFIQAGQFADGYNYLRDIVNQKIPAEGDFAKSQDLTVLAAWFDTAAHINANDGSFVSEFVRGSTEYVNRTQGVPITDQQFQNSSDTLAILLLNQIAQSGSIGTAQEVVSLDIRIAVDTLHMPPWGWAGAVFDIFPPDMGGLGMDVASVPLDKMGVMSDAIPTSIPFTVLWEAANDEMFERRRVGNAK